MIMQCVSMRDLAIYMSFILEVNVKRAFTCSVYRGVAQGLELFPG